LPASLTATGSGPTGSGLKVSSETGGGIVIDDDSDDYADKMTTPMIPPQKKCRLTFQDFKDPPGDPNGKVWVPSLGGSKDFYLENLPGSMKFVRLLQIMETEGHKRRAAKAAPLESGRSPWETIE
jgi:hypothetical protein